MLDAQSLLEQTRELIRLAKEAHERYKKGKEEGAEHDFFKVVKPSADRCEKALQSWLNGSLAYVKEYRPKYIHEEQLRSVEENLNEIVLQSYFCKIHKKRFKDLTESVLYTLKNIEDDIQKGDRG
ncbi:YppE family protein [Bacillus glycinifermentans]|uniref:YppE family protein n=1 Tax=Bacillus glycinifermentans TaxID=1664069 RepID=A0ABU6H0T8_9BACI|nr:YppE family protein [Bacillus glycinifermentans]MEC0484635.1 YppE family protein [Bacillus glycinifermentans]MEC0494704.1 YppE family protein [Bacillus glycinifermentans]MEC0541152.1 YppE family protein [Bacillus glycinifermentans]MEC3609047.1 YppE family protein [Bacillus glycinifermentans]UOY89550.1 YppE family protein [Bacillus glycinifermentans]